MRVTGHQIQTLLKQLTSRRNLEERQFAPSLWVFEGEEKPNPIDVFKSFRTLEHQIARFQTAQSVYNNTVEVTVLEEPMTLQEAVKRVGGTMRMARLWKSLLKSDDDMPRWHKATHGELQKRSKENVYAKQVVPTTEIMARALRYESEALALRRAIQKGNNEEVDVKLFGLPAEDVKLLESLA